MKTQPMAHQSVGIDLLQANPEYYALACEQGTGKTWMILADAEWQFAMGKITGLLVVAPKGVHINWVKREIPAHMSIENKCLAWSNNHTQAYLRKLKALELKGNWITVFTMNIDAVNTPKGYAAARNFLMKHRCMMVVDESQRIKNGTAKRTEKVTQLGLLASSRRIASGTMVTQGPQDIFSQFKFLKEGVVGTRSYRAFVSEYADVLPNDHPLVVAATRGHRAPLMIRRDYQGRPIYRNSDKLHRILKPMMYRVRKQDCLDLPEKIYNTYEFELTKSHMAEYNRVKDELRYQFKDGEIDTYTALTIINKLRQAASGFIMRDGEPVDFDDGGARMDALLEIVEDYESPMIIWAHYTEEIRQIYNALTSAGHRAATYYGATGAKDRDKAIDDFQDGKIDFFISNPAAGGTGITLTAAKTMVYYGNSPSLEHRLQSEDRPHRIGLKHNINVIDLCGTGTIDERLAFILQRKEGTALEIIDGVF